MATHDDGPDPELPRDPDEDGGQDARKDEESGGVGFGGIDLGSIGVGIIVASTSTARALAPAVVLGAALGVAVVACWVQRVGDPVAGLLSFIGIYCAMALLVSAVELAARAGLARIRRGRGAGVARGRRAATVGAVGRPARAPGTPDP